MNVNSFIAPAKFITFCKLKLSSQNKLKKIKKMEEKRVVKGGRGTEGGKN